MGNNATIQYESLLAGQFGNFKAHERYDEYAELVFIIIRCRELNGYPPAQRDQNAARKELIELIGDNNQAKRILDFHVQCENKIAIRKGARENKELLDALGIMRGLDRTPLIAELPHDGAFAVWKLAGSWSGAARIAGLAPLRTNSYKTALERFMFKNASADALPEKIRKELCDEDAAALDEILKKARETGKGVPESALLSHPRAGSFAEHGLNIATYVRKAGVPVIKDGKSANESGTPGSIAKD